MCTLRLQVLQCAPDEVIITAVRIMVCNGSFTTPSTEQKLLADEQIRFFYLDSQLDLIS